MDLAADNKMRLSKKCEHLLQKWGPKIGRGLVRSANFMRARRVPSLRERVEAVTRRGFVEQWGIADPDIARRIVVV